MTFINAMSSKRYYDDAMAVEDMLYDFSNMKKKRTVQVKEQCRYMLNLCTKWQKAKNFKSEISVCSTTKFTEKMSLPNYIARCCQLFNGLEKSSQSWRLYFSTENILNYISKQVVIGEIALNQHAFYSKLQTASENTAT